MEIQLISHEIEMRKKLFLMKERNMKMNNDIGCMPTKNAVCTGAPVRRTMTESVSKKLNILADCENMLLGIYKHVWSDNEKKALSVSVDCMESAISANLDRAKTIRAMLEEMISLIGVSP